MTVWTKVMHNAFPIVFIIYQRIKPASYRSERVYFTPVISEKNASSVNIFQLTLSSSFHDKIFDPVSLF